MATFLVTYDLRNERDYSRLYKYLEGKGGRRVLESVWVVRTTVIATAVDLRDQLKGFVDGDDGLFVAEMKAWAWWKLDSDAHRWLETGS
ncbi:CRISPR-associated endonuclease Cas2 (plasmid) [Mycobacterium sp. C3-094]